MPSNVLAVRWRARLFSLVIGSLALGACADASRTPMQPEVEGASLVAGRVSNISYASGTTPVTAYDPIIPAVGDPYWNYTKCVATPEVGPNADWQNPHPAVTGLTHPWIDSYFTGAGWINAWGTPGQTPPSQGPLGQSWTKYTTTVEGNGDFVIRLLADNCSWIYLDNTLVGVQGNDLSANSYGLNLNGSHELTFVIFDGGGAAGGKFILETTTTPPPPLNPDLDGDGHENTADAFPLNPDEWDDTDGDGVGDNSDAYPEDPTRWVAQPMQSPSATTVTFGPGPFVYTGSAFAATATTTSGETVLATPAVVLSGDCTNAGSTCSATATYDGDPAHLGSVGTATITIAPAPTTTTVSFTAASYVYSGSAIAATASAGATIVYTGSCTNVGTCTATATTAGDANHLGSSAVANAAITRAPSTTAVSFGPGPFPYTGSAYTATASVSPSGSATIAYSGDCINGGITCTATATYAGDVNHNGSQATASIAITYTVCKAGRGDDDDHHGDDDDDDDGEHRGRGDDDDKGSRGVESGSTIPVKLSVCNAQGRNISSRSLPVKAVGISPTGSLNDSGRANPGYLFRLDDGRYMFNLSTKGLTAGNYTLDYTIGNDATVYHYAFTIRPDEHKGKHDGKDDDRDDDKKDGKKDGKKDSKKDGKKS
ncbi:MAG: hypothetical protein Q8K55_05515 [Gemmatimonadaceae bacterium]|nr:hypothetical protein [Gemmatimonadaceae bacterium]